MQIYKVGGTVRDRLLGRPSVDCDWVVVGATAAALEALGYRRVGRDFPVFLHPQSNEEYALARTERKTGRGYGGFAFDTDTSVTLEQDLRRRDVTINAMAEDASGRLLDPWGGERDLRAGLLRHVSPAFVEDPLRVLRVARFAARFGFAVADGTIDLMREIVASGELDALAPERVWTEIERALGEAQPRRFVEVLRECGALAQVLPEVDALFGVPQPAAHHPEIDTGAHVLLALDAAAAAGPDARVAFAVLVHDVGKGATPAADLPRHPGHEGRGVALIDDLCDRLRAPSAFRELAQMVARDHGHCHRAAELRPGTVLELLERADALRRPERFDLFLRACEADARGRLGRADAPYPQAARLRVALAAARTVDARTLGAEGYAGAALGEQLRVRRLAAIAALPG